MKPRMKFPSNRSRTVPATANERPPLGAAFPLSTEAGNSIRRMHEPQKRSCSNLLPYSACDNETFDHLLSIVDDGRKIATAAVLSRSVAHRLTGLRRRGSGSTLAGTGATACSMRMRRGCA